MKNRYSLFIIGAMLAVAWGCNSQSSTSSKKAPCTNPSQSDNEDDDGDDGAYGNHDTSAALGVVDGVSPVDPTYLTDELADQTGLIDQAIEHVAMALADVVAPEEPSSSAALESVAPVEIPSEVVMGDSSDAAE